MNLVANSYLFGVFFIAAVLSDILPFVATIKSVSLLSRNSYRVILSPDLDDSEKQASLLKSSLNILKESIKLTALIALVIVCGYFILRAGAVVKPLSFNVLITALVSFTGLAVSLLAFMVYYVLKKLYVKFRV